MTKWRMLKVPKSIHQQAKVLQQELRMKGIHRDLWECTIIIEKRVRDNVGRGLGGLRL